VKVIALDFGAARTGVAVSDPTGAVARPLCVVERANDQPTMDLLTQRLDMHEKTAWMLRSLLEEE